MALVTKYQGPFGGVNTSSPAIVIQSNEAAQADNWMLRQNFISTRPPMTIVTTAYPGLSITGVGQSNTFTGDVPVNILVAADQSHIYYYSSTTWNQINATAFSAASLRAFDWINTLQSFVFVNESQEVWQFIYPTLALTGLTGGKYGARYIMELAQSLLIGFTTEADGFHPQRIRWCAPNPPSQPGNISQWDPTLFVGAGFSDLLDVSDQITGMFAIGSVGYILRTNGITQVTPTGNGVQPWYFNHLWASQIGVGQIFPQTLAQYGNLVFIAASDNVYLFTSSSFSTIGDKIIYDLVRDVRAAGGVGNTNVYACVTPLYQGGYSYFVYKIFISQFVSANNWNNFIWTYDIRNNNWVRETISRTLSPFTAKPFFIIDSSNARANLYMPQNKTLLVYDTTTLDCDQPATYEFKVEEQASLQYVSVDMVAVRYTNVGIATITVALLGPTDFQSQTLTLGDPTKTKGYYNGGTIPKAVADGKSYIAIFSFHSLTDETFQVTIGRVATSGPVQIESVTVFGEMKEESR